MGTPIGSSCAVHCCPLTALLLGPYQLQQALHTRTPSAAAVQGCQAGSKEEGERQQPISAGDAAAAGANGGRAEPQLEAGLPVVLNVELATRFQARVLVG